MSTRNKRKGPQFVHYFGPVLRALQDLGGSGRPSEVEEKVIGYCGVTEEEQSVTNKNGQSRFRNQVAWAKFYLTKAGFIESSVRGVWSLTHHGTTADLTHEKSLEVFRSVQKSFQPDEVPPVEEVHQDTEAPVATPSTDHQQALLDVLRGLSPQGFERICQRLLRESGFQEVVVTGRSGDGGIDGYGNLQINVLVSFRVLFQCKRYVGSVGSSQVRDFRGAMTGRAEKGIIITTGSFTSEARMEAARDGAPPIELVDGEKLISMFESLQLGLIPKQVFDIDMGFFADFS